MKGTVVVGSPPITAVDVARYPEVPGSTPHDFSGRG